MDELPQTWANRGLCRGHIELISMFYSDYVEEQRQAAKVCRDCPVQVECLAYALLIQEPFGVWGGRTARERKRMNKFGSAFSGYKDTLRHQLAITEPAPVAKDEPNWSIFD